MSPHKTRTDFGGRLHYRLFRSVRTEKPTAVAMEDLDYYDIDPSRLIGEAAFESEAEALDALDILTGSPLGILKTRAAILGVSPDGKTRNDFGDDVHYRLYWPAHFESPTTICVQWFDYPDYDARRLLTEEAYATEEEAEAALQRLLSFTL